MELPFAARQPVRRFSRQVRTSPKDVHSAASSRSDSAPNSSSIDAPRVTVATEFQLSTEYLIALETSDSRRRKKAHRKLRKTGPAANSFPREKREAPLHKFPLWCLKPRSGSPVSSAGEARTR